jgi:hypothetical protein
LTPNDDGELHVDDACAKDKEVQLAAQEKNNSTTGGSSTSSSDVLPIPAPVCQDAHTNNTQAKTVISATTTELTPITTNTGIDGLTLGLVKLHLVDIPVYSYYDSVMLTAPGSPKSPSASTRLPSLGSGKGGTSRVGSGKESTKSWVTLSSKGDDPVLRRLPPTNRKISTLLVGASHGRESTLYEQLAKLLPLPPRYSASSRSHPENILKTKATVAPGGDGGRINTAGLDTQEGKDLGGDDELSYARGNSSNSQLVSVSEGTVPFIHQPYHEEVCSVWLTLTYTYTFRCMQMLRNVTEVRSSMSRPVE